MGVNITVAEIGPQLEERIEAFLASPGGQGARLHLELTERAMLATPTAWPPDPERLRARGIGLAWTTSASATRRWPTCTACRSARQARPGVPGLGADRGLGLHGARSWSCARRWT